MPYKTPVRRRLALGAAASLQLTLLAKEAAAEDAPIALSEIVVQARSPGTAAATPTALTAAPLGQVQTTVGADRTSDTRAFSAADLLLDSPGVSVKQGNGPRDIGISIRGSNARNGFGIRNVVIFDDGFPVTQPDGLSRSDLIDPHAYSGVDVIRGPSSALYGNYATGGVVDFHTVPGRVLDGLTIGTDGGSFGYLNNYLAYGRQVGNVEASVFASQLKGSAETSHSAFNTQTVNALLTYRLTPEDRLTFKFIENHTFADLSNRLSLNQFRQNPYQRGCGVAAANVAGCQNINLLANGFNGATVPQSADQAGFRRNDNRAIFGVRFEHDFGANATWRNQITVDDRKIDQPTGTTSAIGDYPSINVISDAVVRGQILGFQATHYVAAFANTINTVSYTFAVAPGGNATLGGLTQLVPSRQSNYGGRAREEVKLTDRLLLVTGLGIERTDIDGRSTAYTYKAPNLLATTSTVTANRTFLNVAPEASLVLNPMAPWQITGRVATGYGTPQASNLFVNSSGVAGNNTGLKSQSNLGYDLAATYRPTATLSFTVDGFYEFFRNELVTQSPGAGLQSYTFNAPRSEHRGIEAGSTWAFQDGWHLTAAYTYDNQIYTDYREQLSAGASTAIFNRSGNRIPGVPLNELLIRVGYDIPGGDLRGLGAYVEYVKQGSVFIDNANLLKVPGYDLVNLNLHYSRDLVGSAVKTVSAYVEVRNVTNETYIASANNVTNTINAATGQQNGAASVAATSGSIYAGQPRSVYGGVRLRF